MSNTSGLFTKLRTHLFVETLLVVALAVYLVLARNHVVGEDFAFTAVGATLMALVTYWTLNTLRDGLELVAHKIRAGHRAPQTP